MVVIGGGVIYFQFNKSHRDIAGEEASKKVSAVELFQLYVEDEVEANSVYLDQVVEVNGVVAEIDFSSPENQMVVLQSNDDFFGVDVYFISGLNLDSVKEGDEIIVKGHCTGGGDMGVKLSQSTLVK